MDALTGMDGETTTKFDNRNAYMADMAGRLIYEIKNNRVLRMKDRTRKFRSLDYIFKQQLQPLIDFQPRTVQKLSKKEIEPVGNIHQDAVLL